VAKPQTFIKILLDEQTDQELTALAAHLRTTRSAVVRQAIGKLYRAEGEPPAPTESEPKKAAA
jgi:predicted transcriptional regulator